MAHNGHPYGPPGSQGHPAGPYQAPVFMGGPPGGVPAPYAGQQVPVGGYTVPYSANPVLRAGPVPGAVLGTAGPGMGAPVAYGPPPAGAPVRLRNLPGGTLPGVQVAPPQLQQNVAQTGTLGKKNPRQRYANVPDPRYENMMSDDNGELVPVVPSKEQPQQRPKSDKDRRRYVNLPDGESADTTTADPGNEFSIKAAVSLSGPGSPGKKTRYVNLPEGEESPFSNPKHKYVNTDPATAAAAAPVKHKYANVDLPLGEGAAPPRPKSSKPVLDAPVSVGTYATVKGTEPLPVYAVVNKPLKPAADDEVGPEVLGMYSVVQKPASTSSDSPDKSEAAAQSNPEDQYSYAVVSHSDDEGETLYEEMDSSTGIVRDNEIDLPQGLYASVNRKARANRVSRHFEPEEICDCDGTPPTKIMVLGTQRAGKSRFIGRLVSEVFTDAYEKTKLARNVFHRTLNGRHVNLEIHEVGGSFTASTQDLMKASQGFVIMYSVTDASSLKIAKQVSQAIAVAKGTSLDRIPFVLVGAKLDLVQERIVTLEDARATADSMKCNLAIEISSATGQNVKTAMERLVDLIQRQENPGSGPVHFGYLYKRGAGPTMFGKSYKRRMFVLVQNGGAHVLEYYAAREKRGDIKLTGATLKPGADDKTFDISSGNRTYAIKAECADDCAVWLEKLGRAISPAS